MLRAFGWWGLPLRAFTSAFYGRLPTQDGQRPLDRTLAVLLDELEHEPWVLSGERERLEARLRATVRAGITERR